MVLFIKPQITTSNYPMKSRKFVCFVLLLLLLGQTIPACGQTFVNTNADASLTFENAEAWNIVIKKRIQFPDHSGDIKMFYSMPTFSHDYQRIIYCVTYGSGPVNSDIFHPLIVLSNSIVIRSVETFEILKTISIGDIGCFPRGMDVAFSPDEKRAVLGPVCLGTTNLLFINLNTSKVIGVEAMTGGQTITWPDDNYIGLGSGLGLNLDTLKTFTTSSEQARAIQDLEAHVSKHKNCVIELPGGSVASRNHPYSRVLDPNIRVGSWSRWSPDLRYIISSIHTGGNANDDKAFSPVLLELGLRPTPTLDFDIKGLNETLTDWNRKYLKESFVGGKKIWAKLYGGKINPLNDKVVGPNMDDFHGEGFLAQIEPTFQFKFTYEIFPAETNDVVADLRVVEDSSVPLGGGQGATPIWGELVKVGEGGDSGLGAIKVQSHTEQPVSQTQTVQQAAFNKVSQTPFQKLTATVPNARLFANHTREYSFAYDKVWDAVSSLLADQKDKIIQSDKNTGELITDVTRHGIIGFPSFYKYCLLVEKESDASTKVTLKLLLYYMDFDGAHGPRNTLQPQNKDFANGKAEGFLDKVGKRLQNGK
jgi:hypothetical protein